MTTVELPYCQHPYCHNFSIVNENLLYCHDFVPPFLSHLQAVSPYFSIVTSKDPPFYQLDNREVRLYLYLAHGGNL
jgi:hypothetical protein